jgi:FKBP-type peptidyl-prolyl cis-trans isomerase SlyD
MSMLIGDGSVVSIHYTLKDEEGAVIDSSEGADPLSYLHGAGNIIPGLEHALVGKSAGESLEVVVEPQHGYGEYQAELLQVVPRSAFEGVDTIEPGMAFTAQAADGSQRRIVVRDVEGEEVTVDANHELAGMDLHFAVQVVEVREATEEEVAHGHAH